MKMRFSARRKLVERADALTINAKNEGLLSAGKEAWLFKIIGVGGERFTHVATKRRSENQPGNRQERKKLQAQWWAPAGLVNLNNALKVRGVSSKIRLRAIRAYVEGKPMPAGIEDAMASYTEELLLRKSL